mmetsp:Transcript_9888/g.18593  ORF Transcript_9888/g.18593 Transcript_9888/m.18593 type:complete len:269 (-) Transcript_9888:73-879(-)
MSIQHIVNVDEYPLESNSFINETREELRLNNVVQLANFLQPLALQSLVDEACSLEDLAYCRKSTHTIFVKPMNPELSPNHIFNRQVITSKGCVTTDQIPSCSFLKELYYNDRFQKFLCSVLGVPQLFDYKDPLSSITIHYAAEGQELGWHFDNSAFAITLLLQKAKEGGEFEYMPNIRQPDSSTFGFADEIKNEYEDKVALLLDENFAPFKLNMEPGTLVLFRGRDSLHRVNRVVGDRNRILVVLAYNEIPNVRLPDETMMSFFGRTS